MKSREPVDLAGVSASCEMKCSEDWGGSPVTRLLKVEIENKIGKERS